MVILSLALLPTTANAQRGSGRHHGEHGARDATRSAVIAGAPVVRPTVVMRQVVVRQPIVAGFPPTGDFGRIGFGSLPVRTGFGTLPVRTGFEMAPVAGAVVSGRRQGFSSNGFRTFKPGYSHGRTIVVGYPVSYPYVYAPYGVTTSSAGYSVPTVPTPVVRGAGYGAVGVSAGLSTYWTDLANQPGASSGFTFDVSPALTEVFVNGVYVGTVQDFSFDRGPVMVVPGGYRIELRAPGYRTVTLDVTNTAGQVIPYQGELQPVRPY